jgi:hypothetical protein
MFALVILCSSHLGVCQKNKKRERKKLDQLCQLVVLDDGILYCKMGAIKRLFIWNKMIEMPLWMSGMKKRAFTKVSL